MEILIIDDEQPTLRMFRMLLEAMGHTVFTAETGEAGLQQLAVRSVPLVLTDIKMPGMDGIELLGKVKEAHSATEVIVITGHGDMELAIEALNLDATDFINKPVRREQLETAIARAEERLVQAEAASDFLDVRESGERVIISLRGTMGTASEGVLREAFRKASLFSKPLLLDFDETTSVNGAALAVLGECIRAVREGTDDFAPQDVTVQGLSQNFKDVFTVMGISRMVQLQ